MTPVTYLDSSAIVKLAVAEPESHALRRYLRRRRPLVSSALARTEVLRALLPAGPTATTAGRTVLAGLELVRVNDRVLSDAAELAPVELRALDAIHLATARRFGDELGLLVSYDDRMLAAAESLRVRVVAPG
ncbi:MAG: type II toxin-antitoxin system VapC family toxin [Actinomycetota bacterium]|nr:type II toxin-antitoxin system VapC family toxin [Actinomycetota bacterium]